MKAVNANQSGDRLIRFTELSVLKGIPFSRVHIGRLEKSCAFPQRVRLGPNTVAWRESELDEWLKVRIGERRLVAA